MGPEWVVVLEAAGGGGARVEVEEVGALLEAVADARPVALYGADRYALQITVEASGAGEALTSAVARWVEATARVGLAPWELVRAEVISAGEHERDLEVHSGARPGREHGLTLEHCAEPEGEDLLRQALTDPLTDLAGPELFRHHLAHVLAGDGNDHVVLRWHLDDFADLRDRLGSDAADAVVLAIAERLATMVRPSDVVGRLGPDEFALVLDRTPLVAAVAVAGRVMAGLDVAPLSPGDAASLTASMGIAVSRPGEGADALLSRAAEAMADATAAGKATWRLSCDTSRDRSVEPVDG
jgi:diguanylate cyclase (GGDEF)-like protein